MQGNDIMVPTIQGFNWFIEKDPNHGQQKYDNNPKIAIEGQKAALCKTWLIVETPKCLGICVFTLHIKSLHTPCYSYFSFLKNEK